MSVRDTIFGRWEFAVHVADNVYIRNTILVHRLTILICIRLNNCIKSQHIVPSEIQS